MAITHDTTSRNAIAGTIAARVDLGSANAQGRIQIATTAAFTTIAATLLFSNPAFGAASGGQVTANAITPDTNAAGAGADVTAFRVINRDNVEIFRGTVSITGGVGDLQLTNVRINPGDTVTINSFIYVGPQ